MTITFTKQADGNLAVTIGAATNGMFIGIVGRDRNGWWASYSGSIERTTTFSLAMFYVNALSSRETAADMLVTFAGLKPKPQNNRRAAVRSAADGKSHVARPAARRASVRSIAGGKR